MTRDEIIKLAEVCDLGRTIGPLSTLLDHEWEDLHRFAALVAAAERDACAKLIEETDLGGMSADPKLQHWTAALLNSYAAAIRARK